MRYEGTGSRLLRAGSPCVRTWSAPHADPLGERGERDSPKELDRGFRGTRARGHPCFRNLANTGVNSSGPTSPNSEQQRNEETPLLAKGREKWGLRSNGPKTEAAGVSRCTVRKLPFLRGQHLRRARLHRPGW